MALDWQRLQSLSDDEVVAGYEATEHASPGLNFWRDEIWRRESARQTRQALVLTEEARDLTKAVLRLTQVITALTAVNVIAVLISLAL